MKKVTLVGAIAAMLLAGQANAALFLNEVIGSTASADAEFIEIYNSGPNPVDLTNFEIREFESDVSSTPGTLDDTFVIPSGVIPVGGYFVIGNTEFQTQYSFTPDLLLPLSIENSSYTLELVDASSTVLYTAFVTDGDAGDVPSGSLGTADISVGPDGVFLPAGYFLFGDGGSTAGIQDFSVPASTATPGAANPIPEPATLALLGLGGVALLRRRK